MMLKLLLSIVLSSGAFHLPGALAQSSDSPDVAIAAAKAQDKPVFLSIGYATCHWCHAMERESFENEAIAELMHEHYISIKVDREQLPDNAPESLSLSHAPTS